MNNKEIIEGLVTIAETLKSNKHPLFLEYLEAAIAALEAQENSEPVGWMREPGVKEPVPVYTPPPPAPVQQAVPEPMTLFHGRVTAEDGECGQYYVDGWNDCREAMLSAAPEQE